MNKYFFTLILLISTSISCTPQSNLDQASFQSRLDQIKSKLYKCIENKSNLNDIDRCHETFKKESNDLTQAMNNEANDLRKIFATMFLMVSACFSISYILLDNTTFFNTGALPARPEDICKDAILSSAAITAWVAICFIINTIHNIKPN